MHTANSLQDKKKKLYHFFLYKKKHKNLKYVLACILTLITNLLEP
jgi:hypothetical protein